MGHNSLGPANIGKMKTSQTHEPCRTVMLVFQPCRSTVSREAFALARRCPFRRTISRACCAWKSRMLLTVSERRCVPRRFVAGQYLQVPDHRCPGMGGQWGIGCSNGCGGSGPGQEAEPGCEPALCRQGILEPQDSAHPQQGRAPSCSGARAHPAWPGETPWLLVVSGNRRASACSSLPQHWVSLQRMWLFLETLWGLN